MEFPLGTFLHFDPAGKHLFVCNGLHVSSEKNQGKWFRSVVMEPKDEVIEEELFMCYEI